MSDPDVQAAIRLRAEEITDRLRKARSDRWALQRECKHPNKQQRVGCGHDLVECTCQDCGRVWVVPE